MAVSAVLGEWVSRFKLSSLSSREVVAVRQAVVNGVATGIGAAHAESVQRALGVASQEGGEGPCTVMVHGRRLTPAWAGFANAVMVNALGREETHVATCTHPVETTLPVVLAVAEQQGQSGAEALEAVAAGLRATVAVASMALTPPVKYELCEAPAVYGTVGAAAAASKLLGLDAGTTGHALGLAANFAAGLAQCIREGTGEYHYLKGFATLHGYVAAKLASAGASSGSRTFEGEGGFYRLFAGVAPEALASHDMTVDLLEWLEAPLIADELTYKPYPVHFFNQAFVDAGISLRHRGLTVPDVERVRITVGLLAAKSGGLLMPPFTKQANAVASSAFCFASGFARGRMTEQETGRWDAPDLLELIGRTEISVGTELGEARVVMSARGGEEHVFVAHEDGPTYKWEDVGLEEMARSIAQGVLSPVRVGSLFSRLTALEEVGTVAELMADTVADGDGSAP